MLYLITFIVLLTYSIILLRTFFNEDIINPHNKYKIYYNSQENY